MIIDFLVSGMLAGSILVFLAHVAPDVAAGNFVKEFETPRLFGRTLTRREGHYAGILVHLFQSACSGAAFGWVVESGVARGHLSWAFACLPVVLTCVMGLLVLPLEGHGYFGVREDAWFPLDLALTNIVWSFLFWGLSAWFVRM